MLPQWSSRTAVTGSVKVVLAEDPVAGRDGDRAGRLGVHAEGAGGQAGRIDPAQPGGVEGDRGDLFATVEHLRIECEAHAVGWVTAGVGADAGHERTSGGRAGSQERATGDGRCHVDSFVSKAVSSACGTDEHGCIADRNATRPASGAASVSRRRCPARDWSDAPRHRLTPPRPLRGQTIPTRWLAGCRRRASRRTLQAGCCASLAVRRQVEQLIRHENAAGSPGRPGP